MVLNTGLIKSHTGTTAALCMPTVSAGGLPMSSRVGGDGKQTWLWSSPKASELTRRLCQAFEGYERQVAEWTEVGESHWGE